MQGDLNYQPAEYRVRLFLSADLSGSTAYKNSPAGLMEGRDGVPIWVSAFRDFYRKFPARFRDLYGQRINGELSGCCCPALWKALGDELVFCGRVRSKQEVDFCIGIFIAALHDYRRGLQGDAMQRNKIDLKGAAWLAAFPEPNLAVRLQREPEEAESVSHSEALEQAADDKPFAHDFLGKAIDTGFRVAARAERARFAISVQLARLLLSMEEGHRSSHVIHAAPPQSLKGVNDDAPYLTLYIDTMQDFAFRQVREAERKLFVEGSSDSEAVKDYLERYCEAVKTDRIALPDRPAPTEGAANPAPPPVALPESYGQLRVKLSQTFEQERGRGGEDQGDDGDEDGVDWQPAELARLKPRRDQ